MNTNLTFKTLSLTAVLLLAGLPLPGLGQQVTELEKLRASVTAMEQTIRDMNRKIVELEKQRPVPASVTAVQPGVPPATSPGAPPAQTLEATMKDLADTATLIPFRDSIKEDDVGAARPGNAPS